MCERLLAEKSESRSVMTNSLQPHELYPARLPCPWNSPGKNTGVGCHSLLQRIFLTQGLNLVLPHCRQILYRLRQLGSPKITRDNQLSKYLTVLRFFQPLLFVVKFITEQMSDGISHNGKGS